VSRPLRSQSARHFSPPLIPDVVQIGDLGHLLHRVVAEMVAQCQAGYIRQELGGALKRQLHGVLEHLLLHVLLMHRTGRLQGLVQGVVAAMAARAVEIGALELLGG